ncbi:MAG: HTH domain-containing protein [Spirochaetales bacterium]|nr:HTH domain-containing protein [Spirochaetales bacterium]
MVNKTSKQQILSLIKKSDSPLSGEEISREIGITRVAVWKQIQSLIEEGYAIESSSKGYRLNREGDYLSKLEFSGDQDILFYRELNSTMDEAVRQLSVQPEEARSFTVLADHQNAGLGRDENTWESPSGGIYMTFVIRENLPLDAAGQLKKKGIYTALSALQTLGGIPGKMLSYTYEGNLFLREKKIGGLLEEYLVRGDRMLWYTLGLGIHLNDSPSPPLYSVRSLLDRDLNRVAVIKEIKQIWDLSRKKDMKEITDSLEKDYVKR